MKIKSAKMRRYINDILNFYGDRLKEEYKKMWLEVQKEYISQYDDLNIPIAKHITANRQRDIDYEIYYTAPRVKMIYNRDINKIKFETVK